MARANPFLAEGLRTYFSHPGILRTSLVLPGSLALALLASWPRGAWDAFVRSGPASDPFTVTAVTCLALLFLLCARYGAEGFSPHSLSELREFVTRTPISLAAVVGGKTGFAVLHTLFLLLLAAPFLLAGAGVSGAGPLQVLATFAVLFSAGTAVRMYGLLILALLGARTVLRDIVLMPSIALFLVVSLLWAPQLNPFMSLLDLPVRMAGRGGESAQAARSTVAACVLLCVASTVVLGAAVLPVLHLMRARARSGRQRDAE
jgi:hypothetical protein